MYSSRCYCARETLVRAGVAWLDMAAEWKRDAMIAFVQPANLFSLLILPLLWMLALARHATTRPHQRLSFWGSLLVRSLAFGALAGSLAGAHLKVPTHDLTVIFLLDRSDSVSLVQRAQAEQYLRQAIALLPPDARAGTVVFGQQALVARLPSQDRQLGALDAQPGGQRTNIGDAIQLDHPRWPNSPSRAPGTRDRCTMNWISQAYSKPR